MWKTTNEYNKTRQTQFRRFYKSGRVHVNETSSSQRRARGRIRKLPGVIVETLRVQIKKPPTDLHENRTVSVCTRNLYTEHLGSDHVFHGRFRRSCDTGLFVSTVMTYRTKSYKIDCLFYGISEKKKNPSKPLVAYYTLERVKTTRERKKNNDRFSTFKNTG